MKCRICGREFKDIKYIKPYQDICSSKCHQINFWKEIEQEKDKYVFIDGHSYMIAPENSNFSFRGFSGNKFKIKLENGRIIETTNLWHQGIIPEEFKESLKDNAEFI